MTVILTFLFVFLGTYLGVWIFRKWSLKKQLFDIPNERSSHNEPTPRGGGIIIVLFVLIGLIILEVSNIIAIPKSFFFTVFLIAAVSWLDDLISVPFIWRLLVQSVSALVFIHYNGSFDISISYFGGINSEYFGLIITFIWIVWLTNAYNFMDGIDGIAGIQAVTAGMGWLFLGMLFGISDVSGLGAVVAASAVGFLLHNWQPAKVFMGDVGSAFLGFTFAVIPLLGAQLNRSHEIVLFVSAVILVWLFLFDTILTVSRRFLEGKKIWQAHREHLYQKLVIEGFSHQYVTILYGLISVLNAILLVFTIYSGGTYLYYLMIILTIESIGIFMLTKYAGKRLLRCKIKT